MTISAASIVITALLALGFSAVGEIALRRRSAGAQCWNESLLVGAGVCSAALFPLSLLLPRHAVDATLALMGVAALGVTASRILRRSPDSRRSASPAWSRGDLALLALIALAVAAFVVLNFRYSLGWDGFLIFASKAKRLFYEGALTREWFPEDPYDSRLLKYPPLIALSEALLSRVRGSFDFDALKPLFPLFHVSMLMSTFAALRGRSSRRVALFVTLLVAFLPELSTSFAAGGLADMPEAAFVAGTVAACLRTESRRAVPWLIGGLTVVKSEGTILALIASAAVLVFWSSGGLRPLLGRAIHHARAAAIVAAFLLSRFAYLRWLDVHDPTYGPLNRGHLIHALDRIGLVAGLCARTALEVRAWGLLWPAFLIASVLLLARSSRRERCLGAGVWAAILAYAAIFLFTNWPVELHVWQAYGRLLAHVAPAAAVAIGLAWTRVAGPTRSSASGGIIGPLAHQHG